MCFGDGNRRFVRNRLSAYWAEKREEQAEKSSELA